MAGAGAPTSPRPDPSVAKRMGQRVALTVKGAARDGTPSFTVLMTAAYDEIADWYFREFLRPGDPIGIDASLRTLLGAGSGICLEIGCGTGIHADTVRDLGRTPIGIDLSAGMLRHADGRLPVGRADAVRMPVRDGSVPAVIAMMVHTDLPDYPVVLREIADRCYCVEQPSVRQAGVRRCRSVTR